jgi:V/A-type H+-transporting ATPase subunit F
MKIVAIGTEEFCLGFKLAGIKDVYELGEPSGEKLEQILRQLLEDENIGVIIVDEQQYSMLSRASKQELEKLVMPVIIPISKKERTEEFGRLLKRSLGVDLWNR